MVTPAPLMPSKARLADPGLRRAVEAAVRRRVRSDEAEDVVQATFTDVLSAPRLPEDEEELRRFVFGVARNKVFDHFRRQKREESLSDAELAGPEPPLSARDMLRWAEGELGDAEARDTLQWMLREGDGEKLEHIARDAQVPAARLRKRVSRLRKLLRERWAAELMLAGFGAILLLGASLYFFRYGARKAEDVVQREPMRPLPSALPRVVPSAPEQPESRPAGAAERPSPASAAPSASVVPSASPPPKRPTALTPSPKPAAKNKLSEPRW